MEIPKPDDVEGLPNWDYPELQKLALTIEKKYSVQIDRGAKKMKLVKAIQMEILRHPEEMEEKAEDKPKEKPKPKSKKTGTLYYANIRYRDIESGWTYNPETETEPKPIPKLTRGIKTAIADGKIIPVVVGG